MSNRRGVYNGLLSDCSNQEEQGMFTISDHFKPSYEHFTLKVFLKQYEVCTTFTVKVIVFQ